MPSRSGPLVPVTSRCCPRPAVSLQEGRFLTRDGGFPWCPWFLWFPWFLVPLVPLVPVVQLVAVVPLVPLVPVVPLVPMLSLVPEVPVIPLVALFPEFPHGYIPYHRQSTKSAHLCKDVIIITSTFKSVSVFILFRKTVCRVNHQGYNE